MTPPHSDGPSFTKHLRRNFFSGLLVLVPSGITFWVLWTAFAWIDLRVAKLWKGLPIEAPPGAGFFLGAVLVMAIGALANHYLGKRLIDWYEKVLLHLPVINQVFPALRQISGLLFTEERQVFQKVVLVEYPRKGTHVLGFLAAKTPSHISRHVSDQPLVSVFIPTTPNPTSGFLLFVPEEEIQVLPMSPDEGLKLIISGGILVGDDPPAPPTESTQPLALAS